MEIPYTVTARPDTGLWNAKVGIWLFLASEVMLFGGLFSSYLFLRLGADYPWPHGELTVTFGFWNTLILIASSVFVVYAWVSLKMRKYGAYKFWMTLVVACAFGFLINKGFEYNAKFHHYHVTLKDGSVLSGHLVKESDKEIKPALRFEASSVTVDYSQLSGPLFLKYLENRDSVTFKGPNGEVDMSRQWFDGLREAAKLQGKANRLAAAGKADQAKSIEGSIAKKYPEFANYKGDTKIKFTLSQPGKFVVPRKWVSTYLPNELNLDAKYGSPKLEGKLTDDKLKLEIDEVDLRRYLRPDGVATTKAVTDASAFKFVADADREKLVEAINADRNPKLAQLDEKLRQWRAKHPGQEPTEARFHEFERFYLKKLHLEGHDGGHVKWERGEHGPVVEIPWDQVKYFSTFGPHKNTYYAIYFTMTGLHGLHVLAGALVLLYFLLFGRSLYRTNPEHLANRVEVGGLFWHFVDLVWIFLFPIFYLM